MQIPSFRDAQPDVVEMMRSQGGLGVLLFDFHQLGRVERQFGGGAYHRLWAQVRPILGEGSGGGRKPLTDQFRDRGRGFNVLSVDNELPRTRPAKRRSLAAEISVRRQCSADLEAMSAISASSQGGRP